MRSLQPAFEHSSDPATSASSSHLKTEFFAPKPVPVYRAVYWCGQKCTYPEKEVYDEWIEQEKQSKQRSNMEKKKGRPTKVHIHYFLLYAVLNLNF